MDFEARELLRNSVLASPTSRGPSGQRAETRLRGSRRTEDLGAGGSKWPFSKGSWPPPNPVPPLLAPSPRDPSAC